MAGKYDERFDELTGLVKKVSGRVDEMQLDVRDMRKEMQSHASLSLARHDETAPIVVEIQKEVSRISKIQSDQTFKILEMMNRLDVVEIQQRALGVEMSGMKAEIKEIRDAIYSFIDPVRTGWDLRENISLIERRVSDIERKLEN